MDVGFANFVGDAQAIDVAGLSDGDAAKFDGFDHHLRVSEFIIVNLAFGGNSLLALSNWMGKLVVDSLDGEGCFEQEVGGFFVADPAGEVDDGSLSIGMAGGLKLCRDPRRCTTCLHCLEEGDRPARRPRRRRYSPQSTEIF